MSKFLNAFPPNRIFALIGFIAAIAGALASLQTNFAPGSPAAEAISKAIAFLASVGAALAIIIKVLDGFQNWDSLMEAGVPKGTTVINANNVVKKPGRSSWGADAPSEDIVYANVGAGVPLTPEQQAQRTQGFGEDEPPAAAPVKP